MSNKKKVVLTTAQENAIFKAKPKNNLSSGPSWAELGRKYGVSANRIQKAWANANGRSKDRKDKALTTYRNKDKHKNNPSGRMAPINRIVNKLSGNKPLVQSGVKSMARVKDVTHQANQKATQAIRILKQSERVGRGRGGGGAGLSIDDLTSKPGPKRPHS
jgi:hypothetical protein